MVEVTKEFLKKLTYATTYLEVDMELGAAIAEVEFDTKEEEELAKEILDSTYHMSREDWKQR